MADQYFPGGGTDKISDWYTGAMDPAPAAGWSGGSTANAGGGLTSRSVKTVPIDARTGQPVNSWTEMLKAYGSSPNASNRLTPNRNPDIPGSGVLPADWYSGGGVYVGNSVNEFGQRVAEKLDPLPRGGGLMPNPLPKTTPFLPVQTVTPEMAAAYAAVEARQPGAIKELSRLLTAAAQAGNIGKAPVSGGGGIKIGSGGSSTPTTITGKNTGNTYSVGQRYTSGGYIKEAQADGTFKTIGRDPNSNANTYMGDHYASQSGYKSDGSKATGFEKDQYGNPGWMN